MSYPKPFTAQFGSLKIGAVFETSAIRGVRWQKTGRRWAKPLNAGWFLEQPLNPNIVAIFSANAEVEYW